MDNHKKELFEPTCNKSLKVNKRYNYLEQTVIFATSFSSGILARLFSGQEPLSNTARQIPLYLSGVNGLLFAWPKYSIAKYNDSLTEGTAAAVGTFSGYVTANALLEYLQK